MKTCNNWNSFGWTFLSFPSYFQRNIVIMAIEIGMLQQSKMIHTHSVNEHMWLLLLMSMINCSWYPTCIILYCRTKPYQNCMSWLIDTSLKWCGLMVTGTKTVPTGMPQSSWHGCTMTGRNLCYLQVKYR